VLTDQFSAAQLGIGIPNRMKSDIQIIGVSVKPQILRSEIRLSPQFISTRTFPEANVSAN